MLAYRLYSLPAPPSILQQPSRQQLDEETEEFYRRSLDDFVRIALAAQRPSYIFGLARALKLALAEKATPAQREAHWKRFHSRARALLARNEKSQEANDPQDTIAAAHLDQFVRENSDLAQTPATTTPTS